MDPDPEGPKTYSLRLMNVGLHCLQRHLLIFRKPYVHDAKKRDEVIAQSFSRSKASVKIFF
jgi:hypothetical protein